MEYLHIKCQCGRSEKLTDSQADNLTWQEDETLKCHCGKSLSFKGHAPLVNYGVAWVSENG